MYVSICTYDIYMCTDVYTYYSYVSGVLPLLLVHTNLARVGSGWRKTCPSKKWTQIDEKYAKTVSEGKIENFFIETRPEVHHNTTWAHTSPCPVQTNVLLGHHAAGRSSTNLINIGTSIICRCIYVGYEWNVCQIMAVDPYICLKWWIVNTHQCTKYHGTLFSISDKHNVR